MLVNLSYLLFLMSVVIWISLSYLVGFARANKLIIITLCDFQLASALLLDSPLHEVPNKRKRLQWIVR